MILLTLCCLCFVASQCYGNEYPYSLSLHDNYKAFWRFDNESKVFHFKVEVKNVSGWIAFGVSRLLFPPTAEQQWNFNQMEYYDVVVGGIYDNKTTYFQVCIGESRSIEAQLPRKLKVKSGQTFSEYTYKLGR